MLVLWRNWFWERPWHLEEVTLHLLITLVSCVLITARSPGTSGNCSKELLPASCDPQIHYAHSVFSACDHHTWSSWPGDVPAMLLLWHPRKLTSDSVLGNMLKEILACVRTRCWISNIDENRFEYSILDHCGRILTLIIGICHISSIFYSLLSHFHSSCNLILYYQPLSWRIVDTRNSVILVFHS